MAKITPENRKVLSTMKSKLKSLEKELVIARRLEGIDDYVTIKLKESKARFKRIKVKDDVDKAFGKYQMQIVVASKKQSVFIPLNIASGKKATGFMYLIEGTRESSVEGAVVEAKGDSMTQITLGTLQYIEIPVGKLAVFYVEIVIRGKLSHQYRVVINRVNYKLVVTDTRYQQYLKPIASKNLKFS